MKQDNIGLLLYGNVGTGKTFYAACIANTLIDVGVSVLMTNLPRLMTALSKNFEENKIRTLNKITSTSLLVIDDLGIERDTSFAYEKLQEIIDTRYRSGKPLIIAVLLKNRT